jgi:SAM-dependent methyltransferase
MFTLFRKVAVRSDKSGGRKAMKEPVCPLCGTSTGRATRHDGIYACRRHGRFEWFDRERLAGFDGSRIYDAYPYNLSVERDFARMRPLYLKGLRRRVLRYADSPSGLGFLDVGCANGEYLDCARELGMTPVAGVEIDAAAARKAGRFGAVAARVEDVPGSFDVVQCKNVLSNIAEFRSFLGAMLRALKPGGILFLDVLNEFGLTAWAKKAAGRPGILRPPFVINGFSKKALRELVKAHGARVQRLETTYVGTIFLPYRRSAALTIRGLLGKAFGAGTMILADIQR